MELLRERNIPLAIHADLGDDDEPTRYLPLMEEVLRRYPDNAIVWVHMGLSRELTAMDPTRHVALMTSLLERHPKLMLDIAWRRARRCLLLDTGGPGGVRAVPERVLGTDSPRHGLPGVARQGPERLPGASWRSRAASIVIWTTRPSATSPSAPTISGCWVWSTRRRQSAELNPKMTAILERYFGLAERRHRRADGGDGGRDDVPDDGLHRLRQPADPLRRRHAVRRGVRRHLSGGGVQHAGDGAVRQLPDRAGAGHGAQRVLRLWRRARHGPHVGGGARRGVRLRRAVPRPERAAGAALDRRGDPSGR